MMKKSKISILLLFLVMILAISAVSAADINETSDSDMQAVDEAPVDEVASADVDDEVSTDDSAADVLADPGDGNNFTSIQKSIDAITTNPTIHLSSDIERVDGDADITVDKQTVIIMGDNHKIDAKGKGGIFTVSQGCTLVLQDLTLINANGNAIHNKGNLVLIGVTFENNTASENGALFGDGKDSSIDVSGSFFINNTGGAIAALGGSLTVDDTTFSKNTADEGAAILVDDALISISDSIFEDNKATYTGGALSIYNINQNTIAVDNCVFKRNEAIQGGAISTGVAGDVHEGYLIINDCTFDANSVYTSTLAQSLGAAICVGNEHNNDVFNLDIIGSTFTNHVTGFNGAVVVDKCNLKVDDCTFSDNSANSGAALFAQKGTVTITDSNFTNNQAVFDAADPSHTGYAGAVYGENNAVLSIENCKFTDNKGADGGAVRNNGKTTIKDSTFTNNEATQIGGAIAAKGELDISGTTFEDNKAAIQGGAIYTVSVITVDNSNFTSNNITNGSKWLAEVTNGGAGIYAGKGSSLTVTNSIFTSNEGVRGYNVFTSGAGIFVNQADSALIDGCTFDGNIAGHGGAVGFENFSQTTDAIKNSVFNNNLGWQGGAINVNSGVGSVVITDSNFTGNKAVEPNLGSSYPMGGAIGVGSDIDSNVDVIGCNFKNNDAVYGGAIVISGTSYATIDDCTFEDNTATYGGAVNSFTEKEVTVKDSTFKDNTATTYGGALMLGPTGSYEVTGSDFSGNAAPYGKGIANLAELKLSKNNFSSDNADVMSWGSGEVYTNWNIVVMEGKEYFVNFNKIKLYANVTDDNGNLIQDYNLKFTFNGVDVIGASLNATSKLYEAWYTPSEEGTFVVGLNADGDNVNLTTATIRFTRTLSDLATIIDTNTNGTVDLTANYAYVPGFDETVKNGIVIDKDIIINGNGFAICGSDIARLFKVTSGILTLNNVTVCHGIANKWDGVNELGGAVYVAAGAGLVAENVKFINNTAADKGGAIYALGDVTIKAGTEFINNNASTAGAIFAQTGTVLDITGATFTENTANNYGAIYSNGVLTVVGSSFNENSAVGEAGAIRFIGTVGNITSTNFTGNRAGSNGGAVSSWGNLTVNGNSKFENNTAKTGGAIYSDFNAKGLTVSDAQFIGNNATDDGGAIYFTSYSKVLDVSGSYFIDNSAGSSGGAIFGGYNSVEIADSSFSGNDARTGGALYVSGNIDVKESEFMDNEATGNGGALFYFAQTASDKLTVSENTNFTRNKANKTGEAVYVYSGNAEFTDSNFTNNGEAADNAIYNKGTLELTRTTVDNLVYSNGTFNTNYTAIFLDNRTWNDTGLGDIYILNATLTDINGNKIYDPNFRFSANGVTIDTVPLYNETTGLYTLGYPIEVTGLIVISTNYVSANLDKYPGALDIAVANVTEFTVRVNNITDSENATIFITLIGVNNTGLDANIEVFINNTKVIIPVVNGTGNRTIEGFDHGSYPVTAIFGGNSLYNEVINSTVFYVKAVTVLTVDEIGKVAYGDNFYITVNLTDKKSGKGLNGVVVILGQNVAVQDGIGSLLIDMQPDLGEYNVTAVYEGSNDYNASVSNQVTYNVIPKNITADVEIFVNTINEFGDAIPVTIKSSIDGNYTVTVGGNVTVVEVIGGTGSGNITNLNVAGIYTALVGINDGNYTLDKQSNVFEYLITPSYNPVIDGAYPTGEIRIFGTPGDYHVLIDGFDVINITVNDTGVGYGTIPNIAAGNYTAIVTFDAHDEYYGDMKEFNFTIGKANAPAFDVGVVAEAYPGNVTVNVTCDVVGYAVFTVVNDKGYVKYFQLKPGEEFVIEGLDAGKYNISAIYYVDENYEIGNYSNTFEVLKATPEFKFEIGTADYPQDLPIYVNASVAGNITIELLSGAIYRYEIPAGELIISVPGLTTTPKDGVLLFSAGDNYYDVDYPVSLKVNKGAPVIDAVITIDNVIYPGSIKVLVSGPDGEYNITVDGQIVPVTVVAGAAEGVVINDISAGTKTLTLDFAGNDNFNGSSINKTFDIVKATPEISAYAYNVWIGNNNDVYVSVPVGSVGNVTITINGKEYTAEIDSITGLAIATISADDIVVGSNKVHVTFAGDDNYAPNFNSTEFYMYDNVVTNDTFDVFFDNNGNLKSEVPFDKLIFKGEFANLSSYITLSRDGLTITGDEAVLNDIAFIVAGEDITVDNMKLVANADLGNLIDIASVGVTISNMNISYTTNKSGNAIHAYMGVEDLIIVNNTISFVSTLDRLSDDEIDPATYLYILYDANAISIDGGANVFDKDAGIFDVVIDNNEINAIIPSFSNSGYYHEYYLMSVSNVNGVRINGVEDLNLTNNKIIVRTNALNGGYPSLQALYIASSTGFVDGNDIVVLDNLTQKGQDIYIYAVNLYYDEGLSFTNNNLGVMTAGGNANSGAAYNIQIIDSEIDIIGNKITTISNGPNLGIYLAAMGSPSTVNVENNTINIVGLATDSNYGLVSGIEVQDGSKLSVKGNTIRTYNIGEYSDDNYITGISFVQWGSNSNVEIINNTIYTNGKYTVLINKATSLTVKDNYLIAHELYGDSSVYKTEGATIVNNLPVKAVIDIDVNYTFVGKDNVVVVTIAGATGKNITYILNDGTEQTADLIDGVATITLKSDNILLGENTINVTYAGDHDVVGTTESASFTVYDNVVTNDTFFKYFDEEGILLNSVPFNELIFEGEFTNAGSRNTINIPRTVSIKGNGAVLKNIGLFVNANDTKVSDLEFVADANADLGPNLGSVILVGKTNVELNNVTIDYAAPGDISSFAILASNAHGLKLISSDIKYTGNVAVPADSHQYGLAVFDSNNVLISDNKFETALPTRTPDYTSGITQDHVLTVGIQGGENVTFTQNTVSSTVIGEAGYQTLDTIMAYGVNNLEISYNNISFVDVVNTDVGYYNVVDLYSFTGTVMHNNIIVNTTAGAVGSGTAYPIQMIGPFTADVSYNNLTAISTGPAAGIMTANWAGFANLTATFNEIVINGTASSGNWDLSSGIELQVNVANVYNNTVYAITSSAYDDANNIYGISSYQDATVNKLDIRDNFVFSDGKYAILIKNNAEEIVVSENYLYAHDLYGDAAVVSKGTVERNYPIDTNISVTVNNIKVGDDAVINITANKFFTGDVKVVFNGIEETVKLTNGIGSLIKSDLPASNYTVVVNFTGSPEFLPSSDEATFEVSKYDVGFVIETSDLVVDEDVTVTIKLSDVTGDVTVIVDGDIKTVSLNAGVGTFTINKITAGNHTIIAIFAGDAKHLGASETYNFTVDKNTTYEFEAKLLNDTIDAKQTAYVNVTLPKDATDKVYISVDGVEVTYGTPVEGNVIIPVEGLTAGYKIITVTYSDKKYDERSIDLSILVNDIPAGLYASADNITIGENAVIYVTLPSDITGTVKVVLLGKEYPVTMSKGKGNATIADLGEGIFTATVIFEGDDIYSDEEFNVTFEVSKVEVDPETAINVTSQGTGTSPVVSLDLPDDATGYLLVDVNGNQTFVEVVNGKATAAIPKLDPGNYTAVITYTGDDKYDQVTTTTNFTVESNVPETAFTIPETSETNSPTYSINLPSDATGYLIVDVDGTKYAAALVNGSASITVPGLSEGTHNVTVSYTGDDKYSHVSKSTTLKVHIPVYKLKNSKNISVVYSAKATYKVLVTKDGKAVGAGEKVTIKFNGKSKTVKTNSKGYATLKLSTALKPKTYTITATYKGTKVTNKVKVTHVLKVGNKKVKKSRKVTKIKFALKKVNGKYLKGKTLKLKFKGKTYKAKTNKKGVATFKLKKKVFKKLKVGKKYKFTVTYGKDSISKKITIKK